MNPNEDFHCAPTPLTLHIKIYCLGRNLWTKVNGKLIENGHGLIAVIIYVSADLASICGSHGFAQKFNKERASRDAQFVIRRREISLEGNALKLK